MNISAVIWSAVHPDLFVGPEKIVDFEDLWW